ncbi:MAG: hypothetical protein HY866_01040, partial [Chloroflexi bacterium]|nr:hypothetical protein [Chloroflexota bacterium]
MRRLRPQRRRQRTRSEYTPLLDDALLDEENQEPEESLDAIVPFVPVSRERDFDVPDEDELSAESRALLEPPQRPPRRRLRLDLPRLSLGFEIQFSFLLLATALVAAGVFGTLLNQGRLRDEVADWWPLSLVVTAV